MSEKTTELVVNDRRHVPADIAPVAGATIMETLASAVQRGLPIETLNALMDFQERMEGNEARKAYAIAMSAARKAFLPLVKKHSGYQNRYKHEKLSDVCDAVDDALSANGLDYNWVTEDLPDGTVKVTCIMTHVAGHEKSDSGSGDPKLAADPKANMNGFQRRETAISYLKRSTLKSICGIAAGDMDDDTQAIKGDAAPVEYDTEVWLDKIDAAIESKNRKAIEALRDEIQKEAATGKVPKWALDMISAHFSKRLSDAKKPAAKAKAEAAGE